MKNFNLLEAPTPIQYYDNFLSNEIYIKRDDLTDPAMGGNKARKLEYFLSDALEKNADCIVTYGSAQSNHCRITTAAASMHGLKTVLILSRPEESVIYNGNYFLNDIFDSELVWTDVDKVPETIEKTLSSLKSKEYNPYFIQGGGHGNLGTHAYKIAFDEIINQQNKQDIQFNHIFHASGTGTTQAGLVCGSIIKHSNSKVVGISVARNEQRGKEVIFESVQQYLEEFESFPHDANVLEKQIIFNDLYIGSGYADIYPEIVETIRSVAKKSGILLDPVYTGKAFHGMLDYLKTNEIKNKDILFIHTGGTPLLFSNVDKFKEG